MLRISTRLAYVHRQFLRMEQIGSLLDWKAGSKTRILLTQIKLHTSLKAMTSLQHGLLLKVAIFHLYIAQREILMGWVSGIGNENGFFAYVEGLYWPALHRFGQLRCPRAN